MTPHNQPLSTERQFPIREYPPDTSLTIAEFAHFLAGEKPDGTKPQVSYHTARRIIRKHGGYIIVGNGNPGYQPIRIPLHIAQEIKRNRTAPVQRSKNGGRQ